MDGYASKSNVVQYVRLTRAAWLMKDATKYQEHANQSVARILIASTLR